MKKLDRNNSKILNIHHKDLDGCGSSIMLANTFDSKNIEFRGVTYGQVDSVLKATSYHLYDFVIITDVSPTDEKILSISDNILFLDHHDSTSGWHNPNEFKICKPGECATKLVKRFCEKQFKINLSYLNEFADVVNDYDTWRLADPRSKQLNELFYKYWDRKFRSRFMQGNLEFTEEELKYLKQREKLFQDMWNILVVHEIESIKGGFIVGVQMINDLCDKLLKEEGFEFIFCRNPNTENISIRTNRDDIHIGDILSELKIGGGHAKAAGMSNIGMSQCQDVLTKVENKILEKIKEKEEASV